MSEADGGTAVRAAAIFVNGEGRGITDSSSGFFDLDLQLGSEREAVRFNDSYRITGRLFFDHTHVISLPQGAVDTRNVELVAEILPDAVSFDSQVGHTLSSAVVDVTIPAAMYYTSEGVEHNVS